jgi:hypothetical protein
MAFEGGFGLAAGVNVSWDPSDARNFSGLMISTGGGAKLEVSGGVGITHKLYGITSEDLYYVVAQLQN